jgi:hypothetical protein
LGAKRRANRDGSDEKKDSYHRRIISQIIQAEAKGFIQQRLLLTVHFLFGQRDNGGFGVIDALTFKLSGDSL